MPFGPDERERELAFLRDALRASYAHLEVKRRDFAVDLDALYARYRPQIRAAATWSDYERAMVAFVSELHDGHIVWRRQRAPSERRRHIARLGLDTAFVGEELIVAGVWPGSDAEHAGLRAGDRIVRIDGQTLQQRLARYASLRSWSRLEAARYDFAEEWPAQRVEEGQAPRAHILVRERGGATDELTVQAETTPRPGPRPPPLAAQGQGATLVLRARTLLVGAAELQPVLDEVARRLRAGARGVVVDLRGNDGGYDRTAEAIATRLSRRPVTGGERRVRLSPATRAARPQWRDLAEDPARPGWSTPMPLAAAAGDLDPGPLAVIIDAGCRSSCESLALLLRGAGARLVGATTGGSSGGPITVTLPRSGATVKVPVWALFDPAGNPIEDHGVAPDEPLGPGRDDLAAGRDPLLARALVLVGEPAR